MNVLVIRYSPYYCGPVLDRADQAFLIDIAGEKHDLPLSAAARFEKVYRISSSDSLEELASVAADLKVRGVRMDRIVSFVERTQYAAGYLATLLEIPYPSAELTLHTRDKRVMKQLAARAGVAHARFRSIPVPAGEKDTADIGADLGYPLVVKPANGFGSLSTTLVHDEEGLTKALADRQPHPDLLSGHLTVEEYIDGAEFHIDAVWRDGEPWVFCVSRYFHPLLTVATSNGKADGAELLVEEDHPDLYQALLTMHRRVNEALGLRRGATHLEAFEERDTGRMVFSEVASRLGGGNIPALVAAHCGVDQRELLAHELFDGDFSDLPVSRSRFRHLGYVNLVPPRSGVVAHAPETEDVLAHPSVLDATVFVRPGQSVDLSERSVYYIFVTFGADSQEALMHVADDLARTFAIDMA
jgi:biotin carboxylase